MNSTLYLVTGVAFAALTIVYFTLLLRELRAGVRLTSWNEEKKKKYFNGWIIGLLVWGVFLSVWSISGRMADFSTFPFNFMPVLLVPMVAMIVVTLSKSTTEVLRRIPAENLIRLQSFRFFVEILLWMLFIQSLLPVQMTFEGRNFDILAGITGPVIAYFVSRKKLSRTGIIIWNLAGLGLLMNIVTIAILSTPTPLQVFFNEPANTIVTEFPISWLPGFLVPLAYTLHFFSLRQALVANTRAVKPAV